ncbi:MAG: hypothetical protein SF123_11550 [Chloroflexota bacterium]|nr:hypothetical protein [Chloroflexota bacterium]
MLIAIPVAPLVSFAAGLIDGKTVMENLTYSSFQWMLGFSLGMAGAYGLSLAGWYRAARWAAFASATVIIVVQSIGPTASPVEVFYLLALPLAATIFMSRRDAIVLSLVSIVIMFLFVVSNSRIAFTSRTSYVIVASVMNVLAIVIFIAIYWKRSALHSW